MVKDESNKCGFDIDGFKEDMDAFLSALPDIPESAAGTLTVHNRRKLREDIGDLMVLLGEFHLALDPIHHPRNILDPSDPATIGQLIAETLLMQPRLHLTDVAAVKFHGSGVYAIYYRGAFDAYLPASGTETPLYVGKVDPEIPGALTVEQQGLKLYGRLKDDHARSIRAVNNLNLEDFDCRFLVVKSAWQNTAETYLIERFKPINGYLLDSTFPKM